MASKLNQNLIMRKTLLDMYFCTIEFFMLIFIDIIYQKTQKS